MEDDQIKRPAFSISLNNVFLIAAGIGAATVGLKGFLLPNGFLDGGATGISLLLNLKTGIVFPS